MWGAHPHLGHALFWLAGWLARGAWLRVGRRNVKRVSLRCPSEGCTYDRGHLMPCWDGRVDANRLRRL
jgi:hypothetical protein